jgi:hypothetical protein
MLVNCVRNLFDVNWVVLRMEESRKSEKQDGERPASSSS